MTKKDTGFGGTAGRSVVGMSASTAINLFARVVVRTQKLPFEVSTASVSEQDLIERAKDFETGRNIVTRDLIEA